MTQRDVARTAEVLITVTDSLDATVSPAVVNARGLPELQFERGGRTRVPLLQQGIALTSSSTVVIRGLRVCDAQSCTAVALPGATVCQRTGAEEFCGSIGGSAARADGRTVVVCGREAQIGVGAQ